MQAYLKFHPNINSQMIIWKKRRSCFKMWVLWFFLSSVRFIWQVYKVLYRDVAKYKWKERYVKLYMFNVPVFFWTPPPRKKKQKIYVNRSIRKQSLTCKIVYYFTCNVHRNTSPFWGQSTKHYNKYFKKC